MGLYIVVKIIWEEVGWKIFIYMFYIYYEEIMKNIVFIEYVCSFDVYMIL